MQIELKGVGYTYQSPTLSSVALEDIYFSVEKGDFVAIIGPSGSGKSTLAMLLAGLYTPTVGKVLLNGEPTKKNSVFSGVGIVFQYPEQQLFGETVFEEIAFAAKNRGLSGAELENAVYDALRVVGLPLDFAQRSPFGLSGGEKRRVAIASILSGSSEALIFDEPTAGVDLCGQRWLRELANKENSFGKTIFWVSHIMEEVAKLATRVIVLNDGQAVFDGSPQQLFSDGEKIAACGLVLPKGAEFLQKIKARGADIAAAAVTLEGAATETVAWLRGDDRA
ncbi:MAG: ATP-binding cassette domain-containing protein [Thiomicrospira sp.]